MKQSAVREGQTIRFTYMNGTRKNAPRVGLVTQKGDDFFRAYDYGVGEPRSYQYAHADDLRVVADVGEEAVDPKKILVDPEGVPGDLIAQLYRSTNPDVVEARYDAEAGLLVVRRRHDPAVRVVVEGKRVTVQFVNERGAMTGVAFERPDAGPLGSSATLCSPLTPETVSTFVKDLAEHYRPEREPARKSDDAFREALRRSVSGGGR